MTSAKKVLQLDMDWSKMVFEKADKFHENFTKQMNELLPLLKELHIQEE